MRVTWHLCNSINIDLCYLEVVLAKNRDELFHAVLPEDLPAGQGEMQIQVSTSILIPLYSVAKLNQVRAKTSFAAGLWSEPVTLSKLTAR